MSQSSGRQTLTITELTRQIRQGIEKQFTNIWVEGEVSNYTLSSLGHAYFILKDNQCQLKIVIFKTRLRYLKFRPKDGMQLIIHGNITLYEKRGEYQLIGDYLEPKGIGSLQLAFEALKKRLHQEGLFSEIHKKPIPFLPHTIGLITSPAGAALHDFLNVSYRRFPNLHVIINPVRVQGEEAGEEIAQAIRELNELPEVEVIVLTRGGGSLEDLWCFNQEEVARAIFASQKPVVSAVGHEVDFTIADFVADLRAPTPSAAAELVVKDKQQLIKQLNLLQNNLLTNFQHSITRLKQLLFKLQQAPCFSQPQIIILNQYKQQVDELSQRLMSSFQQLIDQKTEKIQHCTQALMMQHPNTKLQECKLIRQHYKVRLEQEIQATISGKRGKLTHLVATLDALSPLQVLKRGYSICHKLPDYELVKDAAQMRENDLLAVKLWKGKLICQITKKEEDINNG